MKLGKRARERISYIKRDALNDKACYKDRGDPVDILWLIRLVERELGETIRPAGWGDDE